MKMKWFFVLFAGAAALWLSGCMTSVDGRSHMGMPLVKDKIEGRYERTPMDVWTAAKDVLAYNGQVTSADVMKSTLEAVVNTRTVWVKVEPVDEKITRVIIETRTQGGMSDLDLAGELKSQVAVRLATGNLAPATKATPAQIK
jgi:hypothetical protein